MHLSWPECHHFSGRAPLRLAHASGIIQGRAKSKAFLIRISPFLRPNGQIHYSPSPE
nr:MAG TPA: hypothetical protein [Caudoviricetes sp.]